MTAKNLGARSENSGDLPGAIEFGHGQARGMESESARSGTTSTTLRSHDSLSPRLARFVGPASLPNVGSREPVEGIPLNELRSSFLAPGVS